MIGPALAALALVASASVWVIPGRFLVPEPPLVPVNAADSAVPTPKFDSEPPSSDWPALASGIEALREPWKGGPAETPTAEVPPVPRPQIAWEYVGYVEAPGFTSAVVVINNEQKFVVKGQKVQDPSWPGTTFEVTEISHEEIEVSHDGQSSKIRHKVPEPATLAPLPGAVGANGAVPGSAERMDPARMPANLVNTPGSPASPMPRRPTIAPGAPISQNPRPGVTSKPTGPVRINPPPSGASPAPATPVVPAPGKPGAPHPTAPPQK